VCNTISNGDIIQYESQKSGDDFTQNIGYGQLKKMTPFPFTFPELSLAGLTKSGEVGEILALYRLKSLSLDYKAKLKSPCFFLQVTLFLQIQMIIYLRRH
jgi:hypothetical protein